MNTWTAVRPGARDRVSTVWLFVTLLAFVFSGQIRYHYPAMPFVILAAGWTLARIVPRTRDDASAGDIDARGR